MTPPRSYRFVQVDVFTDRVFGGNPLAVFLDARRLDDARLAMQGETITGIRVGGGVVPVLEGELRV